MIQEVVPRFRTSVEKLDTTSCTRTNKRFANLNPQCGPWPFAEIAYVNEAGEFAQFSTQLTPAFIRAQILPRGRPHFSLLHIALIDDAIASSSFECIMGESYGKRYRYLELGAIAGFHQEAFFRGSLSQVPLGAVEAQGFLVRWQCMKRKSTSRLEQRGILQIAVLAESAGEELQIASVEIEYFRRHGVLNIVQ